MIAFVVRSVTHLARWPGLALALATALALQVAYQIGTSLLFKVIFDDAIAAHRFEVLAYAVGGLAALLAVLGISGLLQEFAVVRLAGRSANAFRQSIFDRIQAHAPAFFEHMTGGQIGDRFGGDLVALELALMRAVPSALLQSAVILTAFLFLIAIQWQLALIAIASMATILVAPVPFARRAEGATKQLAEAATGLSAMVQESVVAQLVVRIFNLQPARRAGFEARLSAMQTLGARAHFHTGMVARSTYVASGFTQIVVVGVGGYFALRGVITGGELIAFVGLLLSVGEAVGNMTTVMPLLISGREALKRIDEFLGFEPRRLQSADALTVERFDEDIRFEHVTFNYDSSRRTLEDVTLTIRKGQSVAFVGPSGCGKSTMLSLLLRLNPPGGGRILLDGRPIENIAETSLRALITSVPQTPVLLAGTVAENLRLADASATGTELVDAMRRSALGDWVSMLPNGLDTPVGVGGGRLSVGERQRIAIARALLRNAPILVLDEATSALDPHSESAINREILAQAGRHTIVSVTHRLSSVTSCDCIFVFDRGRLVEEGCHEQLVSKAGLYQRLWEKQQGFEVDSENEFVSVTPARLRAIPFLAAAGPQTLERFADAFVFERFSEGTSICLQGDPGDKFYILMRGIVEVLLQDHDGRTRLLGTLTDGDYFGEIALLEERPRTATIRARTECRCLALPRKSFINGLKADPVLAAFIRKAIRDRLDEHG